MSSSAVGPEIDTQSEWRWWFTLEMIEMGRKNEPRESHRLNQVGGVGFEGNKKRWSLTGYFNDPQNRIASKWTT